MMQSSAAEVKAAPWMADCFSRCGRADSPAAGPASSGEALGTGRSSRPHLQAATLLWATSGL